MRAIVVHGGAWSIPDDAVDDHIKGCREAAIRGYERLKDGSAIDAVEEAVRYMEDDPTFDAGYGSFLNSEGEVELDALIVDGKSLRFGAVAGVKRIKNPISLARTVMEKTEHHMFVGEGAEKLAVKIGMKLCDNSELVHPRELERWRKGGIKDIFSTVGAVAMDSDGNLAAAVSTGGTPMKLPGRVGDTPLIGCGAYADNLLGAAASTGYGEAIMRVVLAKKAVDLMEKKSAPFAVKEALLIMKEKTGGLGGLIAVDSRGNIGFYHTTSRMAFAYIRNGDIRASVSMF
ncbi:MAG: isoaspartyl peptidase/L-asparaginase [Candidatus Methanodesulfokora sp.]